MVFIGRVVRPDPDAVIEIFEPFHQGLKGLADFSHLILLYWLHQMDEPDLRNTLIVHPRGNPENPLTGVFATRSPSRPNPIGVMVTRLRQVQGKFIHVGHIDAIEETPIIDIKPYLPSGDSVPSAQVAEWV